MTFPFYWGEEKEELSKGRNKKNIKIQQRPLLYKSNHSVFFFEVEGRTGGGAFI
jgi:hypothetical protein